jgi:catechol-2,3-dioxygenase
VSAAGEDHTAAMRQSAILGNGPTPNVKPSSTSQQEISMLKQMEALTVLPASDLERARTFYHDMLELDPDEQYGDNLIYRVGNGSAFELYETPNAGTAQNTQMCWMTSDLDSEMARLRERGVMFEDYDVPGLTTVNGVATQDNMRTAWFRDSEGNFLCISQMM